MVDEAKVSVPEPSVLSTSPLSPSSVGKVNATPPEVMTTPPVPAGVILMSAFDPFETISIVVTEVAVSVPVTVGVEIVGAVKVLFVNVSVVALPTNVSVAAGIVKVFEPLACCNDAITGVVSVLFVNV